MYIDAPMHTVHTYILAYLLIYLPTYCSSFKPQDACGRHAWRPTSGTLHMLCAKP